MDGIGLFFSATCVMSGRLETIEALVWGVVAVEMVQGFTSDLKPMALINVILQLYGDDKAL